MKRDRASVESDILVAIAKMPFGALVHARVGANGTPVTLEQIAAYLTKLREVLEDHSTRCEEDRKELQQLRANVAAVRSLFGGRP